MQGRPQQLCERQRAIAGRQGRPGRHGARRGYAVPAALRQPLAVARAHGGGIGPQAGAARGVQAVQPVALPDNGIRIAADAVIGRLDHGNGRGSRDRRVHRVAAPFQHAQPCLRRQRLRGDHHALADYGLEFDGIRACFVVLLLDRQAGFGLQRQADALFDATGARPAKALAH